MSAFHLRGVWGTLTGGSFLQGTSFYDVGALVREVIELIAPSPTALFGVDPKLPTLLTTRVPLQQVFMNLIANALKYNPKPEPRVEIGAEPIANG